MRHLLTWLIQKNLSFPVQKLSFILQEQMVIRKHLPIPCLWNTLPHLVWVFCFWLQCWYLCLLVFPVAIGYCVENHRTCKSFQLCREPHEFEEFNMEYPGKKLHSDQLWITKFNLLPSAINKLLDNSIEVKVVGHAHPCKFILIHTFDAWSCWPNSLIQHSVL